MKSIKQHVIYTIFGAAIFVFSSAANAARCTAEAEFMHSYPANELPSKFKIKHRVSSDDCTKYGCSGYVHYTIHYAYTDGTQNEKSTLVSYRISAGQKSREVTDEVYPDTGTSKIKVRDVEIGEVTCSTP